MSSSETTSAALRVDGAYRRFGGNQALDGASLQVTAGEWVGLLGPNGAGKTTLMLAIAGLVRLDAGSVRLLGRRLVPGSDTRLRASVGLVPQEIALYPLLTARENLTAFGKLHGVETDLKTRIDWALDWSGLAARADEPVRGYSGGMQRRLNIACSVLHRPRVVLLDEPTVGVDPQARIRITEMLSALRADGAALVQSTHAFNEIESLCDRMLIMDRGRIIADGTVSELVERNLESNTAFQLTVDRPFEALGLGANIKIERHELHGTFQNVVTELPRLLERIREAGRVVLRLHVDTPGLETVFARLTGRELRE